MLYAEPSRIVANDRFSAAARSIAFLSFGAAVGGMLACAAAEYDDTKLPNFFLAQDAPILLVLSLFLLAIAWAARNGFAPIALGGLERVRGFAPAWVTAIVAGVFICASSRLIYQSYA